MKRHLKISGAILSVVGVVELLKCATTQVTEKGAEAANAFYEFLADHSSVVTQVMLYSMIAIFAVTFFFMVDELRKEKSDSFCPKTVTSIINCFVSLALACYIFMNLL